MEAAEGVSETLYFEGVRLRDGFGVGDGYVWLGDNVLLVIEQDIFISANGRGLH